MPWIANIWYVRHAGMIIAIFAAIGTHGMLNIIGKLVNLAKGRNVKGIVKSRGCKMSPRFLEID